MEKRIITLLFFAFITGVSFGQDLSLQGEWQLVHFDGIDKLRASNQYRGATPQLRADMEVKIKERLENTVYNFVSADSLYYTDYVKQRVIQKKAKIEIGEDQVLRIFDGDQVKEARIVVLEENRLVLEPIVSGAQIGKMTFEPYVKPED